MQVNQDHVCLRDGSHLGVCTKINIWTPLAGPERSPGQMLIVITLEKLSEWSKQRRIYNINTRRLRRKTRIRNHLLKCCPFFVNEEHLHRKVPLVFGSGVEFIARALLPGIPMCQCVKYTAVQTAARPRHKCRSPFALIFRHF